MTFNLALAQQVLDQITEHPHTHDQEMWFSECGTQRCIAGWAVEFSDGYELVHSDTFGRTLAYRPDGTSTPDVDLVAQELLGIDRDTAESIFFDFDNHRALAKFRHLVKSEIDLRVAAEIVACYEREPELV